MDLKALLPTILPHAIAWAEDQAQQTLSLGTALTMEETDFARRVGVKHPERIRVLLIDRPPVPEEPALKAAAMETGLLSPDMIGLTLGYAILIVRGHESTRLLSHECRHVQQYETYGSIEGFLRVYLQQIVDHGYRDSPLEADARAHELDR